MAGAFLVHRDSPKEEMATAVFTLLPQEPLLLAAEEDEARQATRFREWLDESVNVALAEWQKRL